MPEIMLDEDTNAKLQDLLSDYIIVMNKYPEIDELHIMYRNTKAVLEAAKVRPRPKMYKEQYSRVESRP